MEWEEHLIEAQTQSISKEKKEFYVWFETIKEARIFEENIKNNSLVGMTLNEKATRVFEKTSYPLSRVSSALSAKDIQALSAQYHMLYTEEVPRMETYTNRNAPLIKRIQSCVGDQSKQLAIIDTHFDETQTKWTLQLYFVGDPGIGEHGSAVALLAWWRRAIAIDASTVDDVVEFAFEWLVLAEDLWAQIFLMARWTDRLSQTYDRFFEQHRDLLFIGPMYTWVLEFLKSC